MSTDNQDAFYIFGFLITCACLFVYAIDRSCKADAIKREADRAERGAKEAAELEAELKKPKTRLHIETFDDYYFTKYFQPFVGRIGLGHRGVRSSQQVAESTMASSFNRGYFITDGGIHIPTRLIKSVKYTESK